jgi:hypothetical protein
MKDRDSNIFWRYRSFFVIPVLMSLWTIIVTQLVDASLVVTFELWVVVPLVVLVAYIVVGSRRM